MAGRKPKPTAIKKLEGNPGKRKLNKNEPVPAKGMSECPDWLLPEAKAEWERLCEKLSDMGVLTEIDMAAFAAYCQSFARWKEAQEHIDEEGSTFATDKGYQQQTPWVGMTNADCPFMVKVSIPDLNIRKGAGTNTAKTGQCTGIGIFTIVDVREGKGSDKGWGRLKSGAGWISLDYCQRM